MNKIIIDLKDRMITQLGIEAITDFYRTMAIESYQLPGLDAFVTGVDSSSLNVVLDTRLNGKFNLEIIEKLDQFFQSYHVPWGWFITAFAKSGDIEQHGFKLSYEIPSMYFDLSRSMRATDTAVLPIKLEDNDLKEWIKPLQEGFPSNDNCETYRKLNAKLQQEGENRLKHFTAYCNNEAASSGTLFLSDQSVMLHNLATKNKFRHKGIATALTLFMMLEAKKIGYKHCFLDSSDEGYDLYKRIGFKVYGMTSVYELIRE